MDTNLKKNKIAIIIPYFGKWPEWINLYLYSCGQNKFIDWYFFSDCELPVSLTNNLIFKSMSFSEYCDLVSKKLKIDFEPQSAYKLCGLKPFYGFVHDDVLINYDFWGFGDVDVVWGDLSMFYTEKMLNKYDVFSTHADRMSGHLAIIRNIPKYSEACFWIKNWQDKLQNQEAIALDEQDFSWLLFPKWRWVSKFYSKIIRRFFNWRDAWVLYCYIMPTVNYILGTKRKKLFFKEQHTTPILGNDGRSFKHDSEEWLYKNSKIYSNKSKKEYIYLHFMIYKKNSFREDYFWKENFYNLPENYDYSKGVKINTNGFFPSNE